MKFFKRLFQGRINRRTFLVSFLILIVIIGIIDYIPTDKNVLTAVWNAFPINIVVDIILPVLLVIFGWSCYIRRMHDLGHSGWLTLLILIPIINIVLYIILFCFRGDKKINRYGKPPKSQIDIQSLFGLV